MPFIVSHLSCCSRHVALAVSPSPRCPCRVAPSPRVALALSRFPRPVASSSLCRVVAQPSLPHLPPRAHYFSFFFFCSVTAPLLLQVCGDHLPPANARGSEAGTTSQLPVSPPKPHSRRRRRRIPPVASPFVAPSPLIASPSPPLAGCGWECRCVQVRALLSLPLLPLRVTPGCDTTSPAFLLLISMRATQRPLSPLRSGMRHDAALLFFSAFFSGTTSLTLLVSRWLTDALLSFIFFLVRSGEFSSILLFPVTALLLSTGSQGPLSRWQTRVGLSPLIFLAAPHYDAAQSIVADSCIPPRRVALAMLAAATVPSTPSHHGIWFGE